MLSPWMQHLILYLSIRHVAASMERNNGVFSIDTLSEVCYEGARNVETPLNNKSHPFNYDFEIIPTAGTF